MDSVNPLVEAANVNTGLKERHAHTRQSRSVAMEGRIHSDLFAQDRYILGAVPMTRMLSTAPIQRIPSILRITIRPRWV